MKKRLLLTVMMASVVIGNVYGKSVSVTHSINSVADNDVLEIGPKPGRPIPPYFATRDADEVGPRPGQPRPPMMQK